MSIAERLMEIDFLRCVPLADLRSSAPHWVLRTLEAGEILWREGSGGDALAILLDGVMAVSYKGKQVGRVDAGQILGEATAFTVPIQRTASIISASTCDILLLGTGNLQILMDEFPQLYDALLEQSLLQVQQRIASADLQIARIAPAEVPPPPSVNQGPLSRWISEVIRPRPQNSAPPLFPLLRMLLQSEDVSDGVLQALSEAFHPRAFREGERLCEEGDVGDTVFLVAEGEVDVLRAVDPSGSFCLATLSMGTLVGTGGMVSRGARRTATCVAATELWVFEMKHQDYRQLPAAALRALRKALLGALRQQIALANLRLSELNESES